MAGARRTEGCGGAMERVGGAGIVGGSVGADGSEGMMWWSAGRGKRRTAAGVVWMDEALWGCRRCAKTDCDGESCTAK